MSAHEFTLILDHVPTGEELDAFFEAGCDDSTPETVAGSGWLHFDRDAASLLAALTSAIRDVESTGLTVCAVASDDVVSLRDFVRRTGRTYEAARLWASGSAAPGGFPPPVTAADGWSLYSWECRAGPWLTDGGSGARQQHGHVGDGVEHLVADLPGRGLGLGNDGRLAVRAGLVVVAGEAEVGQAQQRAGQRG